MALNIVHFKNVTVPDWSGVVTVGNSTGGTTTAQASDLARPSDWNSAHSIGGQLAGSNAQLINIYEPWPLHNTNSTLSSPGIGTMYVQPIHVPFGLNSGQVHIFVSVSQGFLNGNNFSANSTGSASRTQNFSHIIALYSQGTGASSTRLESFFSALVEIRMTRTLNVSTSTQTSSLRMTNALTISFPSQFDASGGVTYATTSVSGSTSTATTGTANSTLVNNLITAILPFITGARMDMFGFATNLSAGAFWLGHMFTSASGSSGTRYTGFTGISTHSVIGLLENNLGAYKRLGNSTSNSTSTPVGWDGFVATTSSLPIGNLATSDIRAATGRRYWIYRKSAY
jgi:hypothetical protein